MVVCAVITFVLNIISCKGQTVSAQAKDARNIEVSFFLTHAEMPLYPSLARIARICGSVNLVVTVKEGSVIDIVADSSAPIILVEAARKNAATWKFEPDTNGKFEIKFIYDLEKEEVVQPQNPHIEIQIPSFIRITAKPVIKNTLYGKK